MPYSTYRDYLRSHAWKVRSLRCKDRYDHRCGLCYRADVLETHHRTYARLGHELAMDLIPLCEECHALFHHRLPTPPPPDRLMFVLLLDEQPTTALPLFVDDAA